MASSSWSSNKSKTSTDDKHTRTTISDDRSRGSASVHLDISSSELKALDSTRRYNIDHISISPSPMDTGPRLFRPGMLFSSKTYEQSFSTRYNSPTIPEHSDEDEDEDKTENKDENENKDKVEGQTEGGGTSEKQRSLQDILIESREQEMQELAESRVSQRPPDDNMAEFIINELDLRIANANAVENMDVEEIVDMEQAPISPVISTQHSYPPINQTGRIQEHDRPFAEYGDLDRETIAQQCAFNLQPFPRQPPPERYHAKSFAIISSTNVPKETVLAYIQDHFGINKIQYICIGEDISGFSQQTSLNIQIIFKGKIDRRKPFLDEKTATNCNYQVTTNDLAWNEYIKKGGHFIEFGEFQSVKRLSQRQWSASSQTRAAAAAATTLPSQPLLPVVSTPLPPPSQGSVFSAGTTTIHQQQPLALARTTTTIARPTTVRAQAEERRQREDDIAREALALAERSVDGAMDYIREQKPSKFLHHSKWYQETFKYVNLRAQSLADRRGSVDKEYIWPDSFPDCTPELRNVVEKWIRHHFYRVKRAKCLVLIGPTGVGKTSFAMSLPGHVNYFQGRWNLDRWSDYARYSVYDDVPWDDFEEKEHFPNKKGLLTQNGEMGATDKYRSTVTINVQQPAIVLMNPENAGSLLAQPRSAEARKSAAYWAKRATVYEMGDDEYFYKRQRHDQNSSSTTSSMSINDNRLGGPHEFEEMAQHYQEQHGDE